jgi:hypothetical protein
VKLAITLLLVASQFFQPVFASMYYRDSAVGSDAFYNPLNAFSHYIFDTLQLSENFDQENFSERYETVIDNLTHPRRAINNEGGFTRFVNRQIFPVDSEHSDEWVTMLPNYFLHLFGGGMVYRRDLEYFREHDYRYPQTYSITLAMFAEFVQEVFEKKTTADDDEIADFYIFRPLGIWLFSDDDRATYIKEKLDPAIWPYLLYYDPANEQYSNVGISYVVRFGTIGNSRARPFMYFGLNTLLGLTHARGELDHISWGLGYAIESLDGTGRTLNYELRPSFGLFYDRDSSLLWSVILNGTENLKVRANIYPWTPSRFQTGFALGLSDDDEFYFGLSLNMPFGIGGRF